MYVLSTGCQWQYLPKDLPPKSTVHDYLSRWNYDGTLKAIHQNPLRQVSRGDGAKGQPNRRCDK